MALLLLLLLATLRPWVMVTGLWVKCKGRVAALIMLLMNLDLLLSLIICPSDGWIESLASPIDAGFIHKSIKPYVMCPDMAFLLSPFSLHSKLCCAGNYFKSYVKQNKIICYESVLRFRQEPNLRFEPLGYLFQIMTWIKMWNIINIDFITCYVAFCGSSQVSESEGWRLKREEMLSFVGDGAEDMGWSLWTWSQASELRDNVNGSRVLSGGKGGRTTHKCRALYRFHSPRKGNILQLFHVLPPLRCPDLTRPSPVAV